MKALKKVLTLVLAVSMVFTMGIGMSVSAADAPTSNTYNVNADTVKFLGRHFKNGDYTCFSYGAAGVEIKFSGTDLWVDVARLDGLIGKDNPDHPDIMVLVDTLMPMKATQYTVSDKQGWLQVAKDLEDGEHFVRIIKMCRNPGAGGSFGVNYFGIRSIAVNAGGKILTPNAYSDLVIEAYGDSITNGDAVWCTEDGNPQAYTYGAYSGVVSRLLGAELYTSANTGNGLNSWCLGAGNLFPPRESWDAEEPRANQHAAPDHSKTDVLIINLGTNDMAAIGNTTDPECAKYTEEYFKESYISWLEEAYEANPDILCIGALGAMGANVLFDDIQAACDYVNTKYGKEYAYFVELTKCTTFADGAGYDNGHPSNYAHETYGLMLAKLINEKLGLGMEDELNAYVPVKAYPTTVNTNNVAPSATVYTSANAQMTDKLIESANDGNRATSWQISDATGFYDKETKVLTDCWLGFEFETETTISRVEILWEGDTRAATYTIQYSDDGNNWKDVSDASCVKGEVDGSGKAQDVVRFAATTAKYFRINMTEGTSGKAYCPQVFEVYMYGTVASDEQPGEQPDKPVTKGDVNGDGVINSTDFMQVRKHFLGTYTIKNEYLAAADTNGDEIINSTDFMQIRKHFLGTYTIKQ